MNKSDKTIFIVLLSIIIVLIGVMGFGFFKNGSSLNVLTSDGNNIIKFVKDKKNNLSITNNLYSYENVSINYPSFSGVSDNINNIIYDDVMTLTNNHSFIDLNYDVKFYNDKFISMIFYGLVDNKNYSRILNINIPGESEVLVDDIFKDRGQIAVILKSVDAHNYLQNNGSLLAMDYLDNLSYDDLLSLDKIDVYFKEDKIGVSICDIPNSLGSYYLSFEVPYDDLEKSFNEYEYVPFSFDENNLRDFLIGGNRIISESDRALSSYPGGYVFNENGNFSYYYGEKSPSYDGEIISSRGNWWIDSGRLILHVVEEEKVVGGDNSLGVFANYSKQVTGVNYNIEYNVDRLNNSYVVLNNYDKIMYYLDIDLNYVNVFKVLADNGYKDYNKNLENYYKILGE